MGPRLRGDWCLKPAPKTARPRYPYDLLKLLHNSYVLMLSMSNILSEKYIAPGEARTHGLQIMRLTRCLLRYGGDTFSWADHCYRPGGENRSGVGQNHILSLEKDLSHASAGNRTRVNCLEGSYAHHYTTDAYICCQPPPGSQHGPGPKKKNGVERRRRKKLKMDRRKK